MNIGPAYTQKNTIKEYHGYTVAGRGIVKYSDPQNSPLERRMPYVITNPYGGFVINGDNAIIINSGTKSFIFNNELTTIDDYSIDNLQMSYYSIDAANIVAYNSSGSSVGSYIGAGNNWGYTDIELVLNSTRAIVRAFLLFETNESNGVEGIYRQTIGSATVVPGKILSSPVYNCEFAHFDEYAESVDGPFGLAHNNELTHLVPVHSLIDNHSGSMTLRITNDYTPIQSGTFSATVTSAKLFVYYTNDDLPNPAIITTRTPGLYDGNNRSFIYYINIDCGVDTGSAQWLYPIDEYVTHNIFKDIALHGRYHWSHPFASGNGLRYKYVYCLDYHTLIWRTIFHHALTDESYFLFDINSDNTTVENFFDRPDRELVGIVSDMYSWDGTSSTTYSSSAGSATITDKITILGNEYATTNVYYSIEQIKTYAIYKIYDGWAVSSPWSTVPAVWTCSGTKRFVEQFVPTFYTTYGLQ